MMTRMTLDKTKIRGSLYGMLVGDALAMPVHWFYSTVKLIADYGELGGMVGPKSTHADSIVHGMSYTGSLDILHDKAPYYAGGAIAIQVTSDEDRSHYHATLQKGQNTSNSCISRLLMRYLGRVNKDGDKYNPDEFLEEFVKYMTTPPDPNDKDQIINHNDIYLDIYIRNFFTKASEGVPLRNCAASQRDYWSIGSLDGVLMCIPMIVAYAHESEWYVIGRAVEHHMLTHRSVTVTAVVSILVGLLLDLYQGAALRPSLDKAMVRMNLPKISGRELTASYRKHQGPGNIPKDEKWKQHMIMDNQETTQDFVHRMIEQNVPDDEVAGNGDTANSRLSTACYCEHSFNVVLFLAYKYGGDPRKALLQNAMLGGHSTARGAVLGAILGAFHGVDGVPFVEDLCARQAIHEEIGNLVAVIHD